VSQEVYNGIHGAVATVTTRREAEIVVTKRGCTERNEMKKDIKEISLLRLGLPSGLLPPRFLSKILYAFITSRMYYMFNLSHPPLFDHPNNIC
jgi:hypothetical protein